MRIPSGSNTPPIAPSISDRKPAAERSESAKSAPAPTSIDRASARAAAAGVKLGETVASRLQEVRRQLAEGSYPIDFDRLAERILDDEIARSGSAT